ALRARFVAWSMSVTVTPGRTPPVASDTMPESVAVVAPPCAATCVGTSANANASVTASTNPAIREWTCRSMAPPLGLNERCGAKVRQVYTTRWRRSAFNPSFVTPFVAAESKRVYEGAHHAWPTSAPHTRSAHRPHWSDSADAPAVCSGATPSRARRRHAAGRLRGAAHSSRRDRHRRQQDRPGRPGRPDQDPGRRDGHRHQWPDDDAGDDGDARAPVDSRPRRVR